MTAPRRPWALAGLLLLVFALYAPTLANGFSMDDRYLAMARLDDGRPHPLIAEWRPLEILRSHYWVAAGVPGDLYRPVTVLSYSLTYQLLCRPFPGLPEPAPHHLLNVLLHLYAVWLVRGLLLRAGAEAAPALAGAALFGLHALHAEVVAGVVGRAELLAFCCGAAATLGALRAKRGAAGLAALSLAGVLFLLAYGSKESALAWPGLLLLLRLLRPAERGAPALLAAALLPALLYLAARHAVLAGQAEAPAVDYVANPLAHADTPRRLLTAVMLWGYGLYKCLCPFFPACDHGAEVFDLVRGPLDPRFLAALAALLALLLGGLLSCRRRPLLTLAAGAFLGFSVLVSNVPRAIGTSFAERLYYAPSLGLAFLLAQAWPALARRGLAARLGLLLLALYLVANAGLLLERGPVFRDDRTLFLNDVALQPRSVHLNQNTAQILAREGDLERALAHARRAVALAPDYGPIYIDLADILAAAGALEEAAAACRSGLAASHLRPAVDDVYLHTRLGVLLGRLERYPEALGHFEAAIAARPEARDPRLFLLDIAWKVLTPERIRTLLDEGQPLLPWHPKWPLHRAYLALHQGAREEAAALFGRALIQIGVLAERGFQAEAAGLLRQTLADPRTPPSVAAEYRRRLQGSPILGAGERDSR